MKLRSVVGASVSFLPASLAVIAGAIVAASAGCSSSPSSQGAEGQHCFRNGTCDVGLLCLSDFCVRPPDGGIGGSGGNAGNAGSTGGAGRGGSAGGAPAGRGGGTAGATGGTTGATGGSGMAGSTGGGGVAGSNNSTGGAGGSGRAGSGGASVGGTAGNSIGGAGGGMTASCGDGVVTVPIEVCDDGNTVGGDGCAADCRSATAGYLCPAPGRPCIPRCGDGMKIGVEACDDGNTTSGDGCSAVCQVEPGAACTGPASGNSTRSAPACGNGAKEGNEGWYRGT